MYARRLAAAVVLAVATYAADTSTYDSLVFAQNGTCLGNGGFNNCNPPSLCAHDSLTDKQYCCEGSNSVCWTWATEQVAGKTISCGSGINEFYCLQGREQCTQRTGQINICWATAADPVANISKTQLEDAYISLQAKHPSQTYLTVSISDLQSNATTSATSSASVSATGTSTVTSSANKNTTSGVSGGAIAGIIIAIIAVAALLGVGVVMWNRRRRGQAYQELDYGDAFDASFPAAHSQAKAQVYERVELADRNFAELGADTAYVGHQASHELPAGITYYELPDDETEQKKREVYR